MRILYFAWLRERLERAEDEVTPPEGIETAKQLLDWLAERDDVLGAAVEKRAIFKLALDARIVEPDAPIAGAGTMAILPPMTAG